MTGPTRHIGFVALWDPDGIITSEWRAWAGARDGEEMPMSGPLRAFAFNRSNGELQSWDDETSCGVYWGEIYNLSAVGEELAGQGTVVNGASSRLLAAGYETWGGAVFERLEGLFCALLWDRRNEKLVMFRDGSGARSLYWHEANGWAAAATRLDILVSGPGVPLGIGAGGLHEYLRFLDISPPNTIYEGVRALEPGAVTRFAGRGLECAVAEKQEMRPGKAAVPPFEACVDRLDEALRASIAERMEGDGPTGIFLSGGIDSALVAAIAASIRPRVIEAFTVGFADQGFDEAPVAAGIADHLGIRHHKLEYTHQQYREVFEHFAAGVDLPFADPAALPTLLLFRDCHRYVKAVLDGTGADTLVGVMPARHIRIATQYAARLPRRVRQAMGALMRYVPAASGYSSILDFDAPEDLLIRWKGWSRLEIEALCGAPVSLEQTRFFRIYQQFSRRDHFDCYSALLGNLPDDRIHQAAELEALQVRFPYWDRKVEALVRDVPQAYRYTDQEPKRLLRALLERYVPRAIWDRPKHGFDFPFIAFLQQDDHALVKRYLHRSLLERHPIVDAAMVERYARAFMAGELGLGFRIWGLVVLFAWLEHHYDRHQTPAHAVVAAQSSSGRGIL